ncbi:MAG: leucyl aminopeptidase [Sphingomonadaceae bacterium]
MAMPLIAQERAGVGTSVAPATVGNSGARPVRFAASAPSAGTLVMPLAAAPAPGSLTTVFGADAAAIDRAIAATKFDGKAGKMLTLRGIGPWARIILAGTGSEPGGLRDAAGRAAQELGDEAGPVTVRADARGFDAQEAALGYALGQYRFDRYKTVGKSAPPADPVTIVAADPAAATAAWRRGSALVEGVTLARDLTTEPANVIYPESFVARVRTAFAGVPRVAIEVLDEAAMARLNMGSLLGVGQGSRRPSRLLIVRYDGGQGAPLAVVGKGITFDSGGISIKPALAMWQMKSDMAGAAGAIGAALSLAKSGAPVNFVAAAALAENMPGGNAQRPGDVVRTMSGKTIEVLNTDAEGRLVLADAIEYVADRYKPSAIVSIATLTGAVRGALDDEFAGMFARDEALGQRVATAATASGEATWRLPLHANYAEDMKSDIADIKNVVEGGGPGAGLGAHFIGYFVPTPIPWAHLDIAGVGWTSKASPTAPKGASGWGVRLLDAMARGQ